MTRDLRSRLGAIASRSGSASSDFDLNPGVAPAPGRALRGAAVLLPVWRRGGEARLILTKRSAALSQHPGQIAFPGGKIDAGDADAADAALREAEEEIGLPRSAAEILGYLPVHETVTGFTITPVLSWIEGELSFRAEPGEVAEVFTVPMEHVLDPRKYMVGRRRWRGSERRYYTVPWGPYYIWGATARILRGLAEEMR